MNLLFFIFITIISINYTIGTKLQSKILRSVVSVATSSDTYNLPYEALIDLTHNMYSSQIILKAKPINKIISTSNPAAFSVLLEIETVYKNSEIKTLNLANSAGASAAPATIFTKIFLQNITLPIVKASHLNRAQTHHNSRSDFLLNKSYILFLNKNAIISQQQQYQHQQQHDFYTLVNLKSNRYIRERVPKLSLFSNPIEWNEISENFIVNSLCKTCAKNARVEKSNPEIRKYFVGETLEIECKFEGTPLPYLKWTKYNQSVNLNDLRISIKNTQSNSILKIVNLKPTDQADYFCIAYNNVNNTQRVSYTKYKIQIIPTTTASSKTAFFKKIFITSPTKKLIPIVITTTKKTVVTTVKTASLLSSVLMKRKEELIDFEPCENNLDKKLVMKCNHGGQCFKSKNYKYGHQYFRQFCVCTRGFEGKNCELQSIGSWFNENDKKNLPPELKNLYDMINNNNNNNNKQN